MKIKYLISNLFVKAAFLTLFTFVAQAQNDYTVEPIPYQIYTATANVQMTSDDTFSAPIPLGFDFNFYGINYPQVNVSTNGYISFTPYTLGALSPWQLGLTIPDANFQVKNSFLGCYHDMNNSNAEGTITYSIIGSAPYRKLVVLFDNQSHFSCNPIKSTFQMILYETLNILDVQLIDKQVCPTWNAGNAVTGIINQSGLFAVTPPNRNTGQWTASQEGWRFKRPINVDTYLFAKCDDDTDGIVSFNLQVAQNDLWPTNPASVSFYSNESDAIAQTNALTNLNYSNTNTNFETIFANVNGTVKTIVLRVIDCQSDFDSDSVPTVAEDLNNDSNLGNDDTDADGIPNFIDNDDDGDMVLTTVEYVFPRPAAGGLPILDTDNDGVPNYLDNDDDGDGVLTVNEDYNNNNNPMDDDTNSNGMPDYLENSVTLGLNNFSLNDEIRIHPNPTSSKLYFDNKLNESIRSVSIYNINGALIKEVKSSGSLEVVSVEELSKGVYLIAIETGSKVFNQKFIKN